MRSTVARVGIVLLVAAPGAGCFQHSWEVAREHRRVLAEERFTDVRRDTQPTATLTVAGTALRVNLSRGATCIDRATRRVDVVRTLRHEESDRGQTLNAAKVMGVMGGLFTTVGAVAGAALPDAGRAPAAVGFLLPGVPLLIAAIAEGLGSQERKETLPEQREIITLAERRCEEAPLAHVDVVIDLRGGGKLAARTNAEGIATIDLAAWDEEIVQALASTSLVDPALLSIRVPGFPAITWRGTLPVERRALRAAVARVRAGRKPPRLSVRPLFDDAAGTPNSAFDAEESAVLRVLVRNDGRGAAHDVEVEILPRGASRAHVSIFRTRVPVGTLKGGEAQSVEVAIAADAGLPDGPVVFDVRAIEGNGFGSPSVAYEVRGRKLVEPSLRVRGISIRDDGTGLSRGNGNRTLEPDEDIEVAAAIANLGPGPARGVVARLEAPEGTLPLVSRVRVGSIPPGREVTVLFAFRVRAEAVLRKSMALRIVASEERERFQHALALHLPVGSPVIDHIVLRPREVATQQTPPGAGDLLAPLPKGATQTDALALIVGIERYRDVPAADFAQNDARRVHELATHTLGIPPERARMLGERATFTDLVGAFESWLPRNAAKDGLVFVYFSGHGAVDPERGEPSLLPHDASLDYLQTSGYPLRRLFRALAALPTKNVLVVLDACYSGAGARSVAPRGRPLVLLADEAYRVPPNVRLLAAARAREIAGVDAQARLGLFTRHFVDAFVRGETTLLGVARHVGSAVARAAALANRTQHPVALPAPTAHNNLVLVRESRTRGERR